MTLGSLEGSTSVNSLTESLNKVTHGEYTPNESTQTSTGQGPADAIVRPPDLLDLPENPTSRWYLHARAATLRQLSSLGFGLQNRADPPAPVPTSSRWIDSTLSKWSGKGKIGLDIWHPPTHLAEKRGADNASKVEEKGRVGVIVLHGGGFIIGNGTDDSRWAGALMDSLDAIVVAVNYRCAPGHPFPTPVEDGADAILYVAREAKSLGIDPDKLFISGFSAGGNLAFSSYFLLQSPSTWNYPQLTAPRIRGIIAYYPLLDFTISRKDKKAGCCKPEACLPESMTSLFDQSYLHPPPHRSDARVSPAKAHDELFKTLPPVHLCCCEWDMLMAEGERFKQRLESMGKEVNWRLVKGEAHGWDKPPPMSVKPSVKVEYEQAIASMLGWLGEDKGKEEMVKQAQEDAKAVEAETVEQQPRATEGIDAADFAATEPMASPEHLKAEGGSELDMAKEDVMQKGHEERLHKVGLEDKPVAAGSSDVEDKSG